MLGMRAVARKPELAPARTPHRHTDQIGAALDHASGEIASEYAWNGCLWKAAERDTYVARVYSRSFDFDANLVSGKGAIGNLSHGERVEGAETIDLNRIHEMDVIQCDRQIHVTSNDARTPMTISAMR